MRSTRLIKPSLGVPRNPCHASRALPCLGTGRTRGGDRKGGWPQEGQLRAASKLAVAFP